MPLIQRRNPLFSFVLFALFLISFLAVSPHSLWAQTCGNVGNDCTLDAECNDGDPCNGTELCFASGGVDTFSTPTCHCGTPPPDNTVACASDGIFCNGTEQCNGGTCSNHTGNPCTPGECSDACSADPNATTCDQPNGTSCTDSDGNFCTSGSCNGAGSCIALPNDLQCDDLVNCTEDDVCSGGVCNGTAVQCDDSVDCTLDECDEPTGMCVFDSGQCECQIDADCDDANVCTDEFCCTDPATCAPAEVFTCIRSDNSDPCDDGQFCNGPDTCEGGTCSLHDGDPCIGGEQCAETCDEIGDTCFSPLGVACDDADILTITQCDGDGKCATIESLNTQGGSLGCSLSPNREAESKAAPVVLATLLLFSILRLRKSRSRF